MMIVLTLLMMLALLLLKGFFSGSEIALVSADQVKLRHRAANGQSGARLALKLLKNPTRLLTTTLLGTNIASIALTTVGTMLMVSLFDGLGEWLALIIFTPLFLVLGEIVPKSIYQQKADTLVPYIAYPLSWLRLVIGPLVWIFSLLAGFAARLVGGAADDGDMERENFLATVQIAEKTGTAEAFSRGQVRRVLRYAQMTAAEAMWPVGDVQTLDRSASMAEAVALRRATGQRLIPLYENTPSNITAVAAIESWDMLDPAIDAKHIDDYLGAIRFVPHIQRVSDLLAMLHATPDCTIVVVDELGNTMGFITLNLLVRRTLGSEISPLTNRRGGDGAPKLAQLDDGSFIFDARLPIVKVNEELGTALSTLNHHTLGGFALSQYGHLPAEGESFSAEGHVFTASAVNERMILQLTVKRPTDEAVDLREDAATE